VKQTIGAAVLALSMCVPASGQVERPDSLELVRRLVASAFPDLARTPISVSLRSNLSDDWSRVVSFELQANRPGELPSFFPRPEQVDGLLLYGSLRVSRPRVRGTSLVPR
jgi:hypothetical protein